MSPPDFRAAVRRRLSAADADEDVIAELVAQLEDAYEAALARGVDEAVAFQDVQAVILGDAEDWRRLDAYLHTQRRRSTALEGPSPTLASLADASHRHMRDAARHLRRDLPYTLTVALTLSFCIAVGAAVFTIVNAVLLRPLPFPEPDRVVASRPMAAAGTPAADSAYTVASEGDNDADNIRGRAVEARRREWWLSCV